MLDFFRTLPIALERDGLRIVYACWDEQMIEFVQGKSVVKLFEFLQDRIDAELVGQDLGDLDQDLEHQNRNPVKLLTSGPEERSEKPIHSGGRVRNEKRVIWWPDCNGPFCLFGHYSILDGQPRGNET